jgi:hypothetical protein
MRGEGLRGPDPPRWVLWCRPAPGARRPLPGSPGSRAFEAGSSGALWSDTLTRLNDEFGSIPAMLLVAQWATLERSPGSRALRRHPGSPACPPPPLPHSGRIGIPRSGRTSRMKRPMRANKRMLAGTPVAKKSPEGNCPKVAGGPVDASWPSLLFRLPLHSVAPLARKGR